MKLRRNIFLIVLLTAVALIIDAPKNYKIGNFTISSPSIRIGSFNRDLVIKQGLDLQGGTEVTLEANMKDVKVEDRQDALDSAKEIIARRVDLYGVAEPSIKTIVVRIHIASQSHSPSDQSRRSIEFNRSTASQILRCLLLQIVQPL
jgi:preprotein translocase subunit SecD